MKVVVRDVEVGKILKELRTGERSVVVKLEPGFARANSTLLKRLAETDEEKEPK
jgi:hypothetical protein